MLQPRPHPRTQDVALCRQQEPRGSQVHGVTPAPSAGAIGRRATQGLRTLQSVETVTWRAVKPEHTSANTAKVEQGKGVGQAYELGAT
jgi:hypothetical protein